MGQVTVSISNRSYKIACDDGQEDHLKELAERVDASIEKLRAQFGEIGDQRLIVMAAITFADTADDLERRLTALGNDLSGLEDAQTALAEREAAVEDRIVDAIDAVAGRLETLAVRIAGGAGAPRAG